MVNFPYDSILRGWSFDEIYNSTFCQILYSIKIIFYVLFFLQIAKDVVVFKYTDYAGYCFQFRPVLNYLIVFMRMKDATSSYVDQTSSTSVSQNGGRRTPVGLPCCQNGTWDDFIISLDHKVSFLHAFSYLSCIIISTSKITDFVLTFYIHFRKCLFQARCLFVNIPTKRCLNFPRVQIFLRLESAELMRGDSNALSGIVYVNI